MGGQFFNTVLFKGVLSLVLPCLSILRLLLPRCIEQDFFLSFEVTFSFSPSQILHPVHKPCFKVRTQKLSHFGIKLSKILKNGRVATAFFKIFTKRNNDHKKLSQSFFPFLFQRLLHHLWEILRWRLLWFLFFCQFCWRIAE